MKQVLFFILLFITISPASSCSQSQQQNQAEKKVGGGCEGCEAIYESPVALENLPHIDTLPDFFEPGPRLVVSGVVYKADGVTPAPGVVLYVYHTDQNGLYSKGDKSWGKRHGYIRGWMRTNEKGEYKFYTLIPASYPNSSNEKHIHPVIKETGVTEYYIDEFLFDDDKFLTSAKRKRLENRGGNGVLVTELKDGVYYAERNIYLGRNIPGYPVQNSGLQSGLDLGDNCPAFEPIHLSGADKGKDACPMCKYGYGRGVMVWFNHTDLDTLKNFALTFEKEMEKQGEKQLRVFLVYMNPTYQQNDKKSQEVLRNKIIKWCSEQGLNRVAMLWVSSPVDENCKLYHINPKAGNTVMLFQKRKVIAKYVNMNYDDKTAKMILEKLQPATAQINFLQHEIPGIFFLFTSF
jgi:protocatechuate 3,4-dioxygenase beta subunit